MLAMNTADRFIFTTAIYNDHTEKLNCIETAQLQ